MMEISLNQNGNNPVILTKRLSKYKIILAPPPPPPLSRREIADTLRCCRSGMVPGAIRKYLLQKKKNEKEEEEEEIEVEVEVVGEYSSETDNSSILAERDDDNGKNSPEAANVSPDTTTPDAELLHCESGVEMRTPMKRKANDTDKTEEVQVKKKKNRMVPSRKGKSVSASSGKGPVRKVLQEEDSSSDCVLEVEDSNWEKQVQKNIWKTVLPHFEDNLKRKIIPIPRHVGDLIKRAILGIGTRVTRDVPTSALEFLGRLVKTYPLGVLHETSEYYEAAFTNTSLEQCTMSEFLFTLLRSIGAEARAKVQCKALPLFKIITKMVVTQYKEYERATVKLRRPFFVQFLEEQDRILSYNGYCKKLVESIFQLKDFPEEFKTVMRWVGLLSYHLRGHNQLDAEFKSLVVDFGDTLCSNDHQGSKCQIIQAIADPALGAAVCMNILQRKLRFESVEDGNECPTEEEIANYFRHISKSDVISGLKGDLKERRHSIDTSPLHVVSPLLTVGNKKVIKQALNRKGETYLHKLCGKDKKVTNNSLTEFLKMRHESVNPTDNFGNTPLHDAIAHGRIDAVEKFHEFCSDLSLPEDYRVNLLAQNAAGDTALHLAAISSESEIMVQTLCSMANKLQVKEELLKTLNSQGKMPYEMAFNANTRSLLKPNTISELDPQVGNVCVHAGYRLELQSLETKKLVLFWSEFNKQHIHHA